MKANGMPMRKEKGNVKLHELEIIYLIIICRARVRRAKRYYVEERGACKVFEVVV